MSKPNESGQYPVLPLRTEVHLPGTVAPLEIGREASIRAIEAASKDDGLIVVIPQKNPSIREPGAKDLLDVGVRAHVVQVLRHGPNRLTAIVKFQERVRIENIVVGEPFLVADVSVPVAKSSLTEAELAKLSASARSHLVVISTDEAEGKSDKRESKEERSEKADKGEKKDKEQRLGKLDPAAIAALTDANEIADLASQFVELERDDQTFLLCELDPALRLGKLLPELERRATVLRIKADLGAELEGEIAKTQRERVLRDRARQIQEELGEADDNAEIDELRKRVDDSKMSPEARAAARKQLSRMSMMPSASPEYNIANTYVETLLDIPWGTYTDDRIDVQAARALLEVEHSGLDKVKKRILEFIAVRKLKPDKQGPILLLAGPPGVGKTSLGRSIASALGRKYVRISLGGVRDEAEVRGHRRTYIGALPGRIAAGLKKAGSMNPVFVLDEIDKMSSDMRGDPSSAMLEVLDPEQNGEFVDHYVEVPLDLSRVMFLATANNLESIPGPLFDRMELVELSGYTSLEKLAIAKNHLVSKQVGEHGLDNGRVTFSDESLLEVIHGYTREAGVRNLERELASVCRSAAVDIASDKVESVVVDTARIEQALGPVKYTKDSILSAPEVGRVMGLAWTPVGGEVLPIEARIYKGKGELRLTGQLGDVMKESATAAVSWVRSNSARLGIDHDQILASDIHIHLPQGGIKKDGPSAGIALTCAVVSVLTKRPIRHDVALTGEVDLRGRAMPVGGIKEKLLGAHRAGCKIVLLPEKNRNDTLDLPPEVTSTMEIRFISKVDDALAVVLGDAPAAAAPKGGIIPPPTTSKTATQNLPT